MDHELKKRALEKMLAEMNEKHSPAIDRIHNWLCDQDDEELYQGIVKDGKTIHGGFSFAKSKAQKEAKDGVACIDDDTVFGWIREYFTTETPVVPAVTKEMQEADQKGLKAGALGLIFGLLTLGAIAGVIYMMIERFDAMQAEIDKLTQLLRLIGGLG